MLKLTVLYGHPADRVAFERYYAETHLPIAGKMPYVARLELTKFFPNPDGTASDYYRMAEVYFHSPQEMQGALGSPEGQTTVADIPNFATGGVKMLIGEVL